MHKLLLFLKRKEGLTHQAFRNHYETIHMPLAMEGMGPAVRRYMRRYLDGSALPFDVITELWFDDMATARAVQAMIEADRLPAAIITDELRFLDRVASRSAIVEEIETPLE